MRKLQFQNPAFSPFQNSQVGLDLVYGGFYKEMQSQKLSFALYLQLWQYNTNTKFVHMRKMSQKEVKIQLQMQHKCIS